MAEIKNRNVMVGVGELADELGVNRQSIWAVMRGTRTSKRLHSELCDRGFNPAPLPVRKRKSNKRSKGARK